VLNVVRRITMKKQIIIVISLAVLVVLIVSAIIWINKPSGKEELISLRKVLNDIQSEIEASEEAIETAEQLVVELEKEQIKQVEKLAEASLREREVEDDFKAALDDYNLSAKRANRLQEELSKFVEESDLNKIVEIGGVEASLREHQMNLSRISSETSLKSQTADFKREYYELTQQQVVSLRSSVDKLRFDIMEWKNKIVQFKIIIQNKEMQRAFLAEQVEMYAGYKSRLDSLMGTVNSIEEDFFKKQEVDNIISEMNLVKTYHIWEDIPEPSQVQDQIPEDGWIEIQYDF